MRFRYLTLLRYCARGQSENAKKSRYFIGKCKNGDAGFSENIVEGILKNKKEAFFENATLIPVPRSTPIIENATFPAKTIAETLLNNHLGNEYRECIKRINAIKKSSNNYTAQTRNKVSDHLSSLSVIPLLIDTPTLIIVDDVLTLGRTAMACALLLKDIYPDKEIKIFCPFRTRGNDIGDLIDIKEDYMIWNNIDVRLPD